MLTVCNRYKSYFLGILFTLFSFGAYAHSVAVFIETRTNPSDASKTQVKFNVLCWHNISEFGAQPRGSGSMQVTNNGRATWFPFKRAFKSNNIQGGVPGKLVASCSGWQNYNNSANYAYQETDWLDNIDLCYPLAFNMTAYMIETPACNLSGSVDMFTPSVTAQPIASTTLCSSATPYTLKVAATGVNLSYTWQISKDGGASFNNISETVYSGTNSSTLTYTLPVSTSMNGYKYRAIVVSSGTCGGSSRTATTITNNSLLTVNSGVNITSQPANASVCNGGAATFAVNATGSGITYQWQVSTDAGVNFSNVGGATTPTLTINPATASGIYKCSMGSSSSCGGNSTNNASLTVTPSTSIIARSTYTNTICEGNQTPATLTVTATGSGLTYQWQVSTNGGTLFSNVTGLSYGSSGTTATLTITNAPANLNGAKYRCVVAGGCGANPTPPEFLLIVNAKPVITLSPVSKSVCENGTTTFTAAANGTSPTYRWQENGSPITDGAPYSGATTPALTITTPSSSLNRNIYSLIVSSGASCGSPVTSGTATLTVSTLTSITAQPATLTTICEGTNSTISLTATGTGLTYTWQDRPTGSGSYSNTIANAAISGVNSNTLTISSAPGSVAKDYIVQIAGTCGTTSSTVATLGVTLLPRVTVAPVSISACTGSGATMSVTATGSGLNYQWQVSSIQVPTYTDISDDASYSNTTTSTLNITPRENLTGNLYRAKVTNSCSSVYSTPATLTVNTTPNVTVQPANLSLCEYTSGTISITSTGNGLAYQWKESADGNSWTPLTNTRGGGLDDFATTGTTTTKLRLSSVPFGKNNYQYHCQISSTAGCGSTITSTTSTVTVWQRPTITLQPINSNNNFTSNVSDPTYSFKTQVSGEVDPVLNNVFTWYESTDGGRNFSSIAAGTNGGNTYAFANSLESGVPTSLFTLSMPSSRPNSDKIKYLYRCLITGVCKNKTTNVVRVNPPPKIK